MRWAHSEPTLKVVNGASREGVVATAALTVTNGGAMAADATVLAFLRYLGPAGEASEAGPVPRATIPSSGCSGTVTKTDLVQRLVGYQRTGELAPGAGKQLTFSLRLGPGSKSSWHGFGSPRPPCGAYALRFNQENRDTATFVLA